MSLAPLWESLLPVGRDERSGGYRRYSFTEAELGCRSWFRAAAELVGIGHEEDTPR